jgi:FKBP-type peptidyl-prolyl cis-trans isomerase FkpA
MSRVSVFAALIGLTLLSGCSRANSPMPDSGIRTLQSNDVKVGDGAEARKGMTVNVHYTGWLYDADAADHRGKQFDSSQGGTTFNFQLGAGEVIPGWDEGIAGMKVGGTRVLTVPPAMAYAATGAPEAGIPPNATLVFEVQLVDVR